MVKLKLCISRKPPSHLAHTFSITQTTASYVGSPHHPTNSVILRQWSPYIFFGIITYWLHMLGWLEPPLLWQLLSFHRIRSFRSSHMLRFQVNKNKTTYMQEIRRQEKNTWRVKKNKKRSTKNQKNNQRDFFWYFCFLVPRKHLLPLSHNIIAFLTLH